MFTKSIKYASIFLLCFSIFASYYTTYAFWVEAAPSGQIGCKRTGTLIVTCCQDHIINRSPSNPAGTLVTYCTDCEVGPGGQDPPAPLRNCSERYIQMFEQNPNPPPSPPKPSFSEPIPSGVIEQSQPSPPQHSSNVDESNPSQQDFTEQLSSSDDSLDNNMGDEKQNNNNSVESEANNDENENNHNGQNNTNP